MQIDFIHNIILFTSLKFAIPHVLSPCLFELYDEEIPFFVIHCFVYHETLLKTLQSGPLFDSLQGFQSIEILSSNQENRSRILGHFSDSCVDLAVLKEDLCDVFQK